MALFKLLATLGLDDTQFQAGLKRAESGLSSLTRNLAASFSVGAIAVFTKQLVDMSDTVGDLADQLGLATDEVQALQRLASHSGVDINKYAEALVKLKRAKAEALSGNTTVQGQFSALGLSPTQSDFELLRGLGGAKTPQELAAAYDLIGTKAGKILNSLKDIHQLGPLELITPTTVALLSTAKDDLGDIYTTLKSIGANVLGNALLQIRVGLKLASRVAFGDMSPLSKYSPESDNNPDFTQSGYNAEIETMELRSAHMRDIAKKKSSKSVSVLSNMQSFSALPTDDLARIGGSFGSGSNIGAIEREQLQVARRMDARLSVIESKIVSVPTEGFE
jgi:hypothetical protein